jgi:glutamate dehydrogenase (NAD(P)+)
VAQELCGLKIEGARVAVQGFGAVGRHAARFLVERGARLVAASDSHGAIVDADGLDVDELAELKAAGRSVADLHGAKPIAVEDHVAVDCDIWIPAARPDVLHEGNVDRLKARLVLQGANIPATPGAERRMHERGILSVPDFIANAGGVIAAAVEYRGGTEKTALEAVAEKVAANTRAVLGLAGARHTLPREAAVELAHARVERAMGLRRWQA